MEIFVGLIIGFIVAIILMQFTGFGQDNELIEENNKLINLELRLEKIIIDARKTKEPSVITVDKIEKVLFPNTTLNK